MQRKQLDIHRQKDKAGPLLIAYKQFNSKYIIDLNVKAKPTKLLEVDIAANLCNIVLDNSFLDMTPKGQAAKEKNR